MVTSTELAHANTALKRFLPGVNANMTSEFITSGESSIATFYWACVGSLMGWSFAWAIWVLSRFDWQQFELALLDDG
jgi:hypothetical protein